MLEIQDLSLLATVFLPRLDDRGFANMYYFLSEVVDEEFDVGIHRRLSVIHKHRGNALNADYGCRVSYGPPKMRLTRNEPGSTHSYIVYVLDESVFVHNVPTTSNNSLTVSDTRKK